jgi:hypothetical protein
MEEIENFPEKLGNEGKSHVGSRVDCSTSIREKSAGDIKLISADEENGEKCERDWVATPKEEVRVFIRANNRECA